MPACDGCLTSFVRTLVSGKVSGKEADPVLSGVMVPLEDGGVMVSSRDAEELDVEERKSATQTNRKDAAIPHRNVANLK
jgi:hypothetical protein